MPDDNVVKKVLQLKVTGIRKRGRPRLRWTDSVESDLKIVNEKTWRTKKREREVRLLTVSSDLLNLKLRCGYFEADYYNTKVGDLSTRNQSR
ncbi:hypothetical protein TNCV_3869271 [Trichonephila clavipes]|nr:hypothetical protein TNCV_3869271 [Trichonephila clavipes]